MRNMRLCSQYDWSNYQAQGSKQDQDTIQKISLWLPKLWLGKRSVCLDSQGRKLLSWFSLEGVLKHQCQIFIFAVPQLWLGSSPQLHFFIDLKAWGTHHSVRLRYSIFSCFSLEKLNLNFQTSTALNQRYKTALQMCWLAGFPQTESIKILT